MPSGRRRLDELPDLQGRTGIGSRVAGAFPVGPDEAESPERSARATRLGPCAAAIEVRPPPEARLRKPRERRRTFLRRSRPEIRRGRLPERGDHPRHRPERVVENDEPDSGPAAESREALLAREERCRDRGVEGGSSDQRAEVVDENRPLSHEVEEVTPRPGGEDAPGPVGVSLQPVRGADGRQAGHGDRRRRREKRRQSEGGRDEDEGRAGRGHEAARPAAAWSATTAAAATARRGIGGHEEALARDGGDEIDGREESDGASDARRAGEGQEGERAERGRPPRPASGGRRSRFRPRRGRAAGIPRSWRARDRLPKNSAPLSHAVGTPGIESATPAPPASARTPPPGPRSGRGAFETERARDRQRPGGPPGEARRGTRRPKGFPRAGPAREAPPPRRRRRNPLRPRGGRHRRRRRRRGRRTSGRRREGARAARRGPRRARARGAVRRGTALAGRPFPGAIRSVAARRPSRRADSRK